MITGLKLSQFRANVSDFARPNRFEIQISPPSIYKDFTQSESNIMSWLAESATIPQRNQGEITLKYHGMELKLPGDYGKENLEITFLNSYGWEGRTFFERWMETHIQTTKVTNDRRDAQSVIIDSFIIVHQLGRKANSPIASYKFNDVFPTNLAAIDLAMSTNDDIEKFNVSFAYSYWERI